MTAKSKCFQIAREIKASNKHGCPNLRDYILITFSVISIALQICILMHIQMRLNKLRNLKLEGGSVNKLEVTELYATKYAAYLKRFDKHYGNKELSKRFTIFKQSLREIARLNKLSGATYNLTQFSDVPTEELFNRNYNYEPECVMRNRSCVQWHTNSSIDFNGWPVPDRFDWRDHGKVGPVVDQKKCNGCWAFGVVGAMESRAAIINRYFGPSLSVQELIDCSNDTNGCSFGHVGIALDFLCKQHWGIVPEEYYPLKLFKQACQISPNESPPIGLRLQNYWYLCNSLENNEEEILRLVTYHGPVIVVVNAASWRNYIDGVIQRECFGEGSLNHVVQIVGFDLQPEDGVTPPHYIVRNSWGSDFGDGGYVKLAIGNNVCGVAYEVSLVDVYY